MAQHYFIGVKIPSTVESQVNTVKEKYRLHEAYKVIPHIEDLHVTLLYIGAMSEHHLPRLKEQLSKIASSHSPFSMQIDGLSYFGASSGPRVVYLSIEQSLELSALQKEIEHTIAKQLDMPVTNRFVPHITIAKKRKTTDDLGIQKETWTPIEVRVQSFSLFEVHPEKSPKYKTIETFELQHIPST